jgi:hypothetical protein
MLLPNACIFGQPQVREDLYPIKDIKVPIIYHFGEEQYGGELEKSLLRMVRSMILHLLHRPSRDSATECWALSVIGSATANHSQRS